MATEAGKEGYMTGRCHQGGIEDGCFPPLNVVDRVAVDTAQRSFVQLPSSLRAFLNRFVSLFFWKFKDIGILLCGNGLIAKEGPLVVIAQSVLHHCHPQVMFPILGILGVLHIAVNRIPVPYIVYTSPHEQGMNGSFDMLEQMYSIAE